MTTTPAIVPVGNFLADTQVRPDPDVPGRYLGEISEAWRVFYAYGGVSMAVGIRAIEAGRRAVSCPQLPRADRVAFDPEQGLGPRS